MEKLITLKRLSAEKNVRFTSRVTKEGREHVLVDPSVLNYVKSFSCIFPVDNLIFQKFYESVGRESYFEFCLVTVPPCAFRSQFFCFTPGRGRVTSCIIYRCLIVKACCLCGWLVLNALYRIIMDPTACVCVCT